MLRFRKHKEHIPGSIFWKLLFRMVIAGLLIMFLVLGFFRIMFSPLTNDVTLQNIDNYARYIIRDIGDPPDTLRAREVARENDLLIYYQSDQFTWSSVKDTGFIKNKGLLGWRKHPGWWKQHYITKIQTANGVFYFGLNFKFNMEYHAWMVALLVFLIFLILAALHISIRHVLKPIQWLSAGVNEVSKGNFDHQVMVWKMDQLGRLTGSFNDMIRKIKEMLISRNQLLLDVSHEMRSPLTRIKVAMEFMPDGERKESIKEDIAELEQMLTEILETERLNSAHQNLTMEKIDLVAMLREISQKYKDRTPGIDLTALPEACRMKGDAERLKMCLRNILQNSVKFSGGSSQAVQIEIKTEDDAVSISIRDFGRGIPQSELAYIFEPFYRVDKSRSKKTGGYGLGLSLCKKIIEAHNGVIEIESEENKGTLVSIRLPNI